MSFDYSKDPDDQIIGFDLYQLSPILILLVSSSLFNLTPSGALIGNSASIPKLLSGAFGCAYTHIPEAVNLVPRIMRKPETKH